MQAQMNEELSKDKLVSDLVLRQSLLDAEQLAVRRDIAHEQPRPAGRRAHHQRIEHRERQQVRDRGHGALKRQVQGV